MKKLGYIFTIALLVFASTSTIASSDTKESNGSGTKCPICLV